MAVKERQGLQPTRRRPSDNRHAPTPLSTGDATHSVLSWHRRLGNHGAQRVAQPNLSIRQPNPSVPGSGRPLPSSIREFFEGRFEADFSDVRIHTGAEAAQSARSLRARAFTVGRDIVFAAGRYAPGTEAGARLLAHELTHVVQQRSILTGARTYCQLQPDEEENGEASEDPGNAAENDEPSPATAGPEHLMVRPFGVTTAICHCVPEIERTRRHMDLSARALEQCEHSSRTKDELTACRRRIVAQQVKGLPKLKVAGTIKSESGEVKIRARGGSCNAVLEHGARLWGIPTLRYNRLIAESMAETDPRFLEEYDKLQGDPERLDKLFRRFPKEVEKWHALTQHIPTVANLLRQGYRKGSNFFGVVLAFLKWMCPQRVKEKPSGRKNKGIPSSAVATGVWIVVPDPKHAPLKYYAARHDYWDQPGGFYEVYEDDGGLFYWNEVLGQKQYLPAKTTAEVGETVEPPGDFFGPEGMRRQHERARQRRRETYR